MSGAFPEKVHGRKSAPKDGVGYKVENKRDGSVNCLVCAFCGHFERTAFHRRAGDRSGLGRYNRARAAMIRHLYEKHQTAINDLLKAA